MNSDQRRTASKTGDPQPAKTENARLKNAADAASDLFKASLLHHQRGRLAEAEACYRQVLSLQPRHADALNLLGVLALQTGRPALAIGLTGEAIRADKRNALYVLNQGIAYHAAKNYEEAIASFNKAVSLQPKLAEAFYNRGNVFREINRLEEALASYNKALAINPDYIDAIFNRAGTLHNLDQVEAAIDGYKKLLTIEPDNPKTLYSLGNSLAKLGRFDEAVQCYERALNLNPYYTEALNNLGVTLRDLRQFQDAIRKFDQALSIDPNFTDAHCNRGLALLDLSLLDSALESFDRALQIEPNHVEACHGRGLTLKRLNRIDEALAFFEKTLTLQSFHPHAFGGLLGCALALCDWERTNWLFDRVVEIIEKNSALVPPFAAISYGASPALLIKCASHYAARTTKPPLAGPGTGSKWRNDKIKVAYLSGDFHDHATAYLTAGLFESHDRAKFEIAAVSFGPADSGPMRERLVNAFDHFIDVSNASDVTAARILSDMRIDIAVDLKGYTEGARHGILARRPVAVNVSYLGYPGTMGAPFIDYIIADETVAPFEHQPFYSEKIVQLPYCYQANDSKRPVGSRIPSRQEAGLPEDGFVFCCFNQSWKLTPRFFDIWMRLLNAVPNSVLWLIHDNDGAKRNLCVQAQARGIAPERLIFAPRLPNTEHLARQQLASLFLDTLPYNAHTTASDALWVGLPVLTVQGEAFAGRVAASLLRAIGLPELITYNLEDYEALALRLASDPMLLAGYRSRLQANRMTQPLFGTERFCRYIEGAFEQMHSRFQRGEKPIGFRVPA